MKFKVWDKVKIIDVISNRKKEFLWKTDKIKSIQVGWKTYELTNIEWLWVDWELELVKDDIKKEETFKFKIWDKVKIVQTNNQKCKKYIWKEWVIEKQIEKNEVRCLYSLKNDVSNIHFYYWREEELELVKNSKYKFNIWDKFISPKDGRYYLEIIDRLSISTCIVYSLRDSLDKKDFFAFTQYVEKLEKYTPTVNSSINEFDEMKIEELINKIIAYGKNSEIIDRLIDLSKGIDDIKNHKQKLINLLNNK